jgi:hypothetical protein
VDLKISIENDVEYRHSKWWGVKRRERKRVYPREKKTERRRCK